MEIWYWLFILFLITYEPIYGYFDYQKFKEKVRRNPTERVRYYKKVMVGLWVPTFFIIGFVLFGHIRWSDLGFRMPKFTPQALGFWPTSIVIGLGSLYLVLLLYYILGSRLSEKLRNALGEAGKKELEKGEFADIIPVSKQDKKVWTYVSWTAGLTEEILYRGFLIFALSALFPALSIWGMIILSSILFGLAHTYQGFRNVVRTSLIGFFFAILYIGIDSILPLIVLHFLVDYVGKIGNNQ